MQSAQLSTWDLRYASGQVLNVQRSALIIEVPQNSEVLIPFALQVQDTLRWFDVTAVDLEQVQHIRDNWLEQTGTYWEHCGFPEVHPKQLSKVRWQLQGFEGLVLVLRETPSTPALGGVFQGAIPSAWEKLLHNVQQQVTAVIPAERDKVEVPEQPVPPRPPEPPALDLSVLAEHFYPIKYLGIMHGLLGKSSDVRQTNIQSIPSVFTQEFWERLYKAMRLEKETVEAYMRIANQLPRSFNQTPPLVTNWAGNHLHTSLHTGEDNFAFPDSARVFGSANTLESYYEGRSKTAVHPTDSVAAFASSINKSYFTNQREAVLYPSLQELTKELASTPMHWCVVDLGGVPLVLVPKTVRYPIQHSFIGWTYNEDYQEPSTAAQLTFYAPFCRYSKGDYTYWLYGDSPKVRPLTAVDAKDLFVQLPDYAALPRLREPITDVEYMRNTEFVSANISWRFYTRYKLIRNNGEVQWQQGQANVIGYQTNFHEFRALDSFKESTAEIGYTILVDHSNQGGWFQTNFPNVHEVYVGKEPKIIEGRWKIPEGSEVTGDTRLWVDSLDAPEKYALLLGVTLDIHPDNLPKVQADLQHDYQVWRDR